MPKRGEPPREVHAIRKALKDGLDTDDGSGNRIGAAKCGIYAFFDYDDEPIYVGQTYEGLSARIGRHLTNQRTDAVAMNVLDPFEVCDIEMWPFHGLEDRARSEIRATLDRAEYTVYESLIASSTFGAILNEAPVAPTPRIELPTPTRVRIVPIEVYERRKHADIRIARRAATIANLAQVISERVVGAGLRLTLLTQARRLEHLARQRIKELDD
jgi:hypothetical protein